MKVFLSFPISIQSACAMPAQLASSLHGVTDLCHTKPCPAPYRYPSHLFSSRCWKYQRNADKILTVVSRPRRCLRFCPSRREALRHPKCSPHSYWSDLDTMVLDHQAKKHLVCLSFLPQDESLHFFIPPFYFTCPRIEPSNLLFLPPKATKQ